MYVIKNLLGVMAVSVLYKHRRPGIGRSCVVKILILLNLSISGTNYPALTKRPAAFYISLCLSVSLSLSLSLSLTHTHTHTHTHTLFYLS